MERGVPSQADYGGWESVVSSQAGVGNVFWRIFKATERSYLYLYAEILGARPTLGEGIVQNRARTYRAVTDRASC